MPTGNYHDQASTALTNAYVLFTFTTQAISFSIMNDDAADSIQVSYDGVTQSRNILAGEEYNWVAHANGDYKVMVYLKSTAAGASYRLETTEG